MAAFVSVQLFVTLLVLVLLGFANSYAVIHPQANTTLPLLAKRQADPANFGWIKRWAAIGDSFTAGIGSGAQLGKVFHRLNDWLCSRYDGAYPMVLNRAFGPAVDDFQFEACSGARSDAIYKQATTISGNLNFVTFTAGGNDLCLAGIIERCVFLPYPESWCQEVLDKARENIGTILKPNLKDIVAALNPKMAAGGIVVFNGYAQFFNTENEDCANKQSWGILPFTTPLTIQRRDMFNDLVVQINAIIKSVVDEAAADPNIKFNIGFSNWDIWPSSGVSGQMCDPSSSGAYPDPDQPDLQFFKPITSTGELELRSLDPVAEEMRQRFLEKLVKKDLEEESLYDSLLWKSPNPAADALHKLDPRAPSPPGCPGDGQITLGKVITLNLGMPDSFGRVFHPNELGHNTIASFAVQTMIDLRAKVLGVEAPSCQATTDQFTCWQKDGRKAYASAHRMDENYKNFCNEHVKQPPHTVGWSSSKTYHQGTPEEHTLSLQLSTNVADFDRLECLESFKRIIHGCDGNDPDNPMNWKFGGRWERGDYTYEATPKADKRPWPPIQHTYGKCEGWYKVFFSSYEIYGAGFSGWDYGQKTLLPSIKGCLGLGVTKWKFEYINPPTKEGWEWKATFNTPIWVRSRCFKNNKVVRGAEGGFTDGCGGND